MVQKAGIAMKRECKDEGTGIFSRPKVNKYSIRFTSETHNENTLLRICL